MAYCARCGKQIPDGARFCNGCGSPVTGAPGNGNYGYSDSENGNYGYGAPGNNDFRYNDPAYGEPPDTGGYHSNEGYGRNRDPYSSYGGRPDDVVRRIRETGGSVLHLVLILCMAASVVMSFMTGGSILGIPGYSGMGTSMLMLIGNIPVILMVIGLLMFFVECRSKAEPKGSGIGVYKAAKIIMIVFFAVLFIVFLIALLFGGLTFSALGGAFGLMFEEIFSQAGLGSSAYGYGTAASVMAGVMITIVIIIAVIIILAIVLEVKLMNSANVVRNTLRTGKRCGTVPVFPVVIEILLAIGTIFSMINAIGSAAQYTSYFGGGYAGFLMMPMISSIISTVQVILTIVMLIKIRAAVGSSVTM